MATINCAAFQSKYIIPMQYHWHAGRQCRWWIVQRVQILRFGGCYQNLDLPKLYPHCATNVERTFVGRMPRQTDLQKFFPCLMHSFGIGNTCDLEMVQLTHKTHVRRSFIIASWEVSPVGKKRLSHSKEHLNSAHELTDKQWSSNRNYFRFGTL